MGQGEASNWYFGNQAGIRFNNDGTVTAVNNGRLNTTEGCATISDASGNLLFYTDGITVHDRNHSIMPNGTGLYGDPSSTQSAIIVPKPEDPNVFYIFTVDTSTGQDPDRGLNYSVVDMSLNGGNGEVIQKNINLLIDCTEKITAVIKDCFDKSIWVLTLATEDGNPGNYNTYHAFEVNTSGVVTTSVKSTFPTLVVNDHRGYLKLSSDGTKMASANMSSGLYLYNFDAQNGIVSNQTTLNISSPNYAAYGIEFSPSNQYLYVHASNDNFNGPHSSSLVQFDVTSGSINGSKVIIDTNSIYRGALQQGSNGKIYRTIANSYQQGTQYLGVINNPDAQGVAANYQHNAVYLGSGIAMQGLPPFIQSFFDKTDIIRNADGTTSSSLEVCETDAFTLETDNMPGATYVWEKDGTVLTNTTHTLQVNNVTTTDAGRYTVEITPADPSECPIIGEAQILVNPLPIANTITLTQCDLDNTASTDGITGFNLQEAINDITGGAANTTVSFFETITDRDNNIPINNPIGYTNTTAFNQTIYVSVTNENGCINYADLHLTVEPTSASLTIQGDYYACQLDAYSGLVEGSFDLESIRASYTGLDVAFYTSREDASLELNAVSGTNYISETATLYARIENSNQCKGIEQINLHVDATPQVNIADEFLLCTDNPPLSIIAEGGFDSYQWFKIENGTETLVSSNQTALIQEIGNYRLELGYSYAADSRSCTNSKDFVVLPSNIAIIENVEVQDIRENNIITILVSGDGDYEYALGSPNGPYQDSNVFENVPAGLATIFVRDKNGCGTTPPHTVSVIGYPKFFTPNGDNVNDFWQIKGANTFTLANTNIFIFDRYGRHLASISPNSRGWDGNSNGQPLPSSDYWFRVYLQDGRQFNGHFTLKR